MKATTHLSEAERALVANALVEFARSCMSDADRFARRAETALHDQFRRQAADATRLAALFYEADAATTEQGE
jgi:hypothetical protein